MAYEATLTRTWGGETDFPRTNRFLVLKEPTVVGRSRKQDFRLRLLDAIGDFLCTEDGLQAWEETCEDFNWGDAIMYVPEEIWHRYGLHLLSDNELVNVSVRHNEVHRPSEEVLENMGPEL